MVFPGFQVNSAHRLSLFAFAHLSTPLLSAALLTPFLPSNLLFEIVPFYRSARALLSRKKSSLRQQQRQQQHTHIQQWLAYWLIYAFVRFLEKTRFNLDNLTSSIHFLGFLNNARLLFRNVLSMLFLTSTSPPPRLPFVAPLPLTRPRRSQSLAVQLGGSSTRWTVIKCCLLFYAMDEKLQGARWILEKFVKPFVGFFTGLEEEDGISQEDSERAILDTGEQSQTKLEQYKQVCRLISFIRVTLVCYCE